MKFAKYILTISILVLSSCKTADTLKETTNNAPKNVILLIGDGTGLSGFFSILL